MIVKSTREKLWEESKLKYMSISILSMLLAILVFLAPILIVLTICDVLNIDDILTGIFALISIPLGIFLMVKVIE